MALVRQEQLWWELGSITTRLPRQAAASVCQCLVRGAEDNFPRLQTRGWCCRLCWSRSWYSYSKELLCQVPPLASSVTWVPSLQKVPNPFAAVWGLIYFTMPVMSDRNWHGDNEDCCRNDQCICKTCSLNTQHVKCTSPVGWGICGLFKAWNMATQCSLIGFSLLI